MKYWQPERLRRQFAGPAGKRLRTATVLVIAAALLNVLIYTIAVAPAAGRLGAEQGRLAGLKRQFADALLFQKQKQALAGLNQGILTQKDVPLLIKDLVQMARRQNLAVGTINSDIPLPSNDELTMITFTVPVSGSYSRIKRYIYDVETTDRLIGIQDLRFAAEKQDVKLDMKLVTYIREE
jgi:Tfp pilus assembly protein PilO